MPVIALTPAKDDLVLRPLAIANGNRHYVLLHAVSQRYVSGPFETLGEAVIAARQIALEQRVAVWHEPVDDRGRVMGDLRRLLIADR